MGVEPHRAWQPLIDHVAIVTGASSGIGAATAHELGRRGAKLVLAARRADALDAQAQAMRTVGMEVLTVPTDVGVANQACSLANNAGINWTKPLAQTSPDEISRILAVNLLGAMLITQAVLPGMLTRGYGFIIFVGSLSGRVAMEPLYSATKYGLRGFSLALRRQTAGTGVSVCLISPGNINTAMTSQVAAPMPGPELVATTIAGLIRHPRREVVVPRRHYALAWLEELSASITDRVHRARGWSPVHEQEVQPWKS
jgi:short-subunit dehydrogenase